MRSGNLNRIVSVTECTWLDQDLPNGKAVFKYDGCTHGCVTSDGVAVSDTPGELPFYEVPSDAVTWS